MIFNFGTKAFKLFWNDLERVGHLFFGDHRPALQEMAGQFNLILTGSFWAFSADYSHNACWSNPMESVVRTNANDWSGRMQTGGQVECNYASGSRKFGLPRFPDCR